MKEYKYITKGELLKLLAPYVPETPIMIRVNGELDTAMEVEAAEVHFGYQVINGVIIQ